MIDITTCRFIKILHDGQQQEEINESYQEFREMLIAISDSNESYSSVFRILTGTQALLQILPTLRETRAKKKSRNIFLSQTGHPEY